jgi:hypothetical protein
MIEASENQGCDRHLFGLSMIAYQTGKSFELTNDPSWIKRYLKKKQRIYFEIDLCLVVEVEILFYQLVVLVLV